jgi:hypothetical protein
MKKLILLILAAATITPAANAQKYDYRSVAQSVIDTTEKYLYNPAIIQSKEWAGFKNTFLEQSANAADDTEFRKMFRSAASALPFTHFGLIINAPAQSNPAGGKAQEPGQAKFAISTPGPGTVLFTVRTFAASAEEIAPYLDSLKAMSFSNLIIDLRNNYGGTIASALPLASYLVNDTLLGGAFLTRRYFNSHGELPKAESYITLPHFSEASFAKIISGIHNEEGLCLVVYPAEMTYKGRLFILTNKNTASTCEPLVYGLKASGRAVIVGETTMGAMLNGEQFIINDRFSLFLPTADFYTADGKRIDRIGVEPDVKVDPTVALEKTMEIINGNNGL